MRIACGARILVALAALVTLSAPAVAAVPYSLSAVTIPSTTAGAPQDLPATLLKPAGDGPFPAIVILHDCSGLGPRSSGAPGRWGAFLAGEGYVVVIPDSFQPRGFPAGVCTLPPGTDVGRVLFLPRSIDAYAALAFLRALPYVDGRHVGVMGGSHGGSSTLATLVAHEDPVLAAARRDGFAAGIAFYPGCGAGFGPRWRVRRQAVDHGPVIDYVGTYRPLAPLLILIGAEDDWTPAEHCRVLAERAAAAGYPVTIKIYPGALHAFDGGSPRRFIEARRNANSLSGQGATTGGDAASWADSIERVKAFFAAHLKPAP